MASGGIYSIWMVVPISPPSECHFLRSNLPCSWGLPLVATLTLVVILIASGSTSPIFASSKKKQFEDFSGSTPLFSLLPPSGLSDQPPRKLVSL